MKYALMFIPLIAFGQIQKSANNLYLTNNGSPLFLLGTAPWDINNLTYTEACRYMDSSYAYGINYYQIRMMSPTNFGGTANAYGVEPWVTTQTFASTPTTAFWAHLDSVVDYGATKGIVFMLYPDYLGGDPSQGWSGETAASSLTQMYTWGQYVGNRYKDKWNVMWALGGDVAPGVNQAKLDTLADGIRSTGDTHLMSTRDESGTTIDDHWNTSTYPWITYNYLYSYSTSIWDGAQTVRSRGTAMPCDLRETYYENEAPLGHTTTQTELRASIWDFTLWMGGAVVLGNCPEWSFDNYSTGASCDGKTWTDQLNSQGKKNLKWLGKAIRNRRWWTFIPDTSNAVLTSGQGSGSDLAVCAYASDGSTIMVYSPASTTLTVTSAGLVGTDSTYSWWYNPETGAATWIGNETQASHTYATGGENVLVLDAKSMSFPAPGLDTTVTQQPTARYLRAQRR